jgi:hypothetical protein
MVTDMTSRFLNIKDSEIVEEITLGEVVGRPDATDIVTVANLIAHMSEPQCIDLPEMSKIPACIKLGVDEELSENLLLESKEEVRSLSQALQS